MNAILAILNAFLDPAETVRLTGETKWAWLAPVAVGGLIAAFYNYSIAPLTIQVMRYDPPAGLDPAKLDQAMAMSQKLGWISAFSAPITYGVTALITAGLIFAACAVLSVNVRFPALYNLVVHVGLINAVQMVAHYFVLKNKGELTSIKELAPSFGPEIFLSDDAPKLLAGFLSFFSVFTVWHIVMIVIGVAALTNVGKGKAFLLAWPTWALGLINALFVSQFR